MLTSMAPTGRKLPTGHGRFNPEISAQKIQWVLKFGKDHMVKARNQKNSRIGGLTEAELAKLIQQYGCGPVRFSGTDEALYERHLIFDNVMKMSAIGTRERFEAIAHSVRDLLSQRWIHTEKTYE